MIQLDSFHISFPIPHYYYYMLGWYCNKSIVATVSNQQIFSALHQILCYAICKVFVVTTQY